MIDEKLSALTPKGRDQYERRVLSLVYKGYNEKEARLLAAGELPEDRKHWPPKLAYRTIRHIREGKTKQEAIEEVRQWFRDWFRANHEHEEDS